MGDKIWLSIQMDILVFLPNKVLVCWGVFSNGYSTNAVTISFMRSQIWVAKAVFKYLHYFTKLAILLPYKCIFALNSENCLNFNLLRGKTSVVSTESELKIESYLRAQCLKNSQNIGGRVGNNWA